MPRLAEAFARCKERNEGALIAFVTAGDPSLEALPEICEALVEGGIDALEVGIPFSDPIADGPAIQASSQRALERGARFEAVLEAVGKLNLPVPVVLMGYYNMLMARGLESTAQKIREAGARGMIVCDLTPEEARDWTDVADANGIDTVFLAAPTSTDARLQLVAERGKGFIYALARTGVTGVSAGAPQADKLLGRLRPLTPLPIAIGFGIGSQDQVRSACALADGAIVGSRIVTWLHENWDEGRGRSQFVDLIRDLKAGTRK